MLKYVFLIGGMSESGKSSVGRYLDSLGVKRLKIVTYLKKVMESEGASGDFQQWNEQAEAHRSGWLSERFLEEFEKSCEKDGTELCCLESLYRPEFGEFVRTHLPGRAIIVFVDVSFEIRILRQMHREGLLSVEAARKHLALRDKGKEKWGTHRVKDVADIVIDNSGTIEDLYRQIDEMITRFCPK